MKRLAQELNVPVIGVSQYNRDPARQNRRPELSDLRESGQLEQDADVVLFPWSDTGLEDTEIRAMKLYCAKQRNGSVGWEIPIDFDGEKQWFFTEELYKEARFA
jgi:replicative DNA helicase